MVDTRNAPHVGPLLAEITAPESEKFTAPLVLVHGLWDGPAVWHRWVGSLAHYGWYCVAVARREVAGGIDAHARDLRAAIAGLAAPPVIIGHDLGALLALHCADAARAVVALAPLVAAPAGAPQALDRAGTWLARWRGAPLGPPRGRWRGAYPDSSRRESAALIGELLADRALLVPARPSPSAPSGVFAVAGDEVTAVADAARLAQSVGADFEVVAGTSHAALTAPGWESRVAAVHRWIIRRLGVDLLALFDEAMQRDE
jgi:pimeloyl-ACP methyl ester carboxylesterase